MSSATCEERGIIRNDRIRNHDNGWVFARVGIEPTQAVLDSAMLAVGALGLDFGAVDIATTRNNEKPIVVFEINTAPGIEGTTLEKYLDFFKEKCRSGN
jgi:glutathione synthase/RimK-type ligase-like ATP-grasp enzyme